MYYGKMTEMILSFQRGGSMAQKLIRIYFVSNAVRKLTLDHPPVLSENKTTVVNT